MQEPLQTLPQMLEEAQVQNTPLLQEQVHKAQEVLSQVPPFMPQLQEVLLEAEVLQYP